MRSTHSKRQCSRQALAAQRGHFGGETVERGCGGVERRRLAARQQRGGAPAQIIVRGFGDAREPGSESRPERLRQRLGRGPADHHEIVPQPQQCAQQGALVGLGCKTGHPLMPGFGRDRVELYDRRADAGLHVPECLLVQAVGKTSKQFGQQPPDQVQQIGGALDRQVMRAGWKHHQRHREADDASDRDLDDAFDCGRDRTGMGDEGRQEHHDRRERRGAEARICRRQQGRRRNRKGERRQQRGFIVVRDERPHCAGIGGAADGGDEIVHGRLERSADAHLRQDHRRQHGPQGEGKVQQMRDRQAERGGDRHPQAQPQFGAALAQRRAQPLPGGREGGHAEAPIEVQVQRVPSCRKVCSRRES